MWGRISAIVLRHFYLHRRSPARIMEIVFWPVMNLLVWGFVTLYFQSVSRPGTVSFLFGAIILWDVLYRSQQAISLAITEEFWVRNFINIFISPITIPEFVIALCLSGLFKTLITTALLGLLASFLFSYNLTGLGLALAVFLFNLQLFGWAVGLFTMGIILRFGRAAEGLIWGMPFLLQPVTAVFYPVAVLPPFLQTIAWSLPATHVFEGLRAAMQGKPLSWSAMAYSLGLNLVYLTLGAVFFGWMLKQVKIRGYLSRQTME